MICVLVFLCCSCVVDKKSKLLPSVLSSPVNINNNIYRCDTAIYEKQGLYIVCFSCHVHEGAAKSQEY